MFRAAAVSGGCAVIWELKTSSILRGHHGKICFSKQFGGISDVSAPHRRHCLGCRDAAAARVINLLHKSLLSFHSKFHGISTASCQTAELPPYPQVPWFSLAFSTHRCQRSPQNWGGDFWKIQSKHCNGEIVPPDVRKQKADWVIHCLSKPWKRTCRFFHDSPFFSRLPLLSHICIYIWNKNHLGNTGLGIFCFHCSLSQIKSRRSNTLLSFRWHIKEKELSKIWGF